jgi:hypothetical protein
MQEKIRKCQLVSHNTKEGGKEIEDEVSTTDEYPETSPNMDENILIWDGTFVCVLKAKEPKLFGVVVGDVTKDDQFGTV